MTRKRGKLPISRECRTNILTSIFQIRNSTNQWSHRNIWQITWPKIENWWKNQGCRKSIKINHIRVLMATRLHLMNLATLCPLPTQEVRLHLQLLIQTWDNCQVNQKVQWVKWTRLTPIRVFKASTQTKISVRFSKLKRRETDSLRPKESILRMQIQFKQSTSSTKLHPRLLRIRSNVQYHNQPWQTTQVDRVPFEISSVSRKLRTNLASQKWHNRWTKSNSNRIFWKTWSKPNRNTMRMVHHWFQRRSQRYSAERSMVRTRAPIVHHKEE